MIAVTAIILLAAASLLLYRSWQADREANSLNIRTAGRLLAFTGLDEEELSKHLEKKESAVLTYEDTAAILEYLGLEKTIHADWGDLNGMMPKADFLAVYDEITALLDTDQTMNFEKLYLIADHTSLDTLKESEVYTQQGTYTYEDITVQPYIDAMVEVISRENEILCIRNTVSEEARLQNVWITEVEADCFEVFVDGHYITFAGETPATDVKEQLADIVLQDGQVTAIRAKEEQIAGKILAVQEDGVEIEGYGLIPFAEGFRVYKTYGELQQLTREDLIPGYEQTEFIVADGKICGGLIVRTFSAENIRVLIKTTDYKSITHSEVSLTPSGDYVISYDDEEEEKEAGTKLKIGMDSEYWEETSRIIITPEESDGTITLHNVERSHGNPAYRGIMEVVKTDDGLIIINEVALEEYLYSVLPSEMPVSYGLEALKAQAVCARSYAYNQLEGDTYAEYGAHVDDSTTFQVYQNNEEDEEAIRAVDETNGLVMQSGGEVITAYYFSTSSGHTTTDEAWGNEKASSFLSGTPAGHEDIGLDLTKEEDFAAFISETDYEAFDKEEPWYRWRFTLTAAQLGNIIDANLSSVIKARPEAVTVRNDEGEYVKKEISSVGSVSDIKVESRGTGGIVAELIVTGSDAQIKVTNEYAIRQLLGIGDKKIKRQDDSEVKGGTLLPSAYFYIKEVDDDDGLKFRFYGGGYGHGIGMSQNAAKAMAAEGMDFQEILEFFYKDIEIKEMGN